MPLRDTAFAALLATVFLATSASAQRTYLTAQQVQPSARALAMGGASTAVPWGSNPDPWANPALIAHLRGLHLDGARSDTPVLNQDQLGEHSSFRVAMQHWGVGLMLTGWPGVEESGTRLDAGEVTYTPPGGDPTTEPLEYHQRGIGIGVNILALRDALAGRPVDRDRPFDFSFGYQRKYSTDGPGFEQLTENTLEDAGILLQGQLWPWLARRPSGLEVDAAVGIAWLNQGHEDVESTHYLLENWSSGILQTRRLGMALNFTMGRDAPATAGRWSRRLRPVAELRLAYDRGKGARPSDDSRSLGAELKLWKLLALRVGKSTVGGTGPGGPTIDRLTWGVGLGAEADHLGGFELSLGRAEAGTGPGWVEEDDDPLDLLGFSAWVDVVGLASR